MLPVSVGLAFNGDVIRFAGERVTSDLNFLKDSMKKGTFYQKQKTAMMATRIGFFTFFKLGWSNKVDRTP